MRPQTLKNCLLYTSRKQLAITKILAAFTLFVVTFLVGITVHILILDAAFGPVSYTHLDVYKRQEVDMDEDDAARLMQGHYKECPYYQNDDEYAVCLLYTSRCV